MTESGRERLEVEECGRTEWQKKGTVESGRRECQKKGAVGSARIEWQKKRAEARDRRE